MAKLLIVDDSSFARNNMRIMVEKGGHEIAGLAGDGEQALSLYKSLNPDLVMLDYLMKGKSGMEVLKELIQYDPGAKIIMVSGLGDSTIEDDTLEAGAKFFVRKPYAQESILNIIDQIMKN